MPGINWHLPPQEEKQKPEKDEDMTSKSSGEEESEDEDDSSEASSIIDDPTIQAWVPNVIICPDESVVGRVWTRPSTMEDDFEEVVTRNTARRGLRRPNTATRSRVSRRGAYAVRRGRFRQPVANQGFIQLLPIELGLSFNGFARDLEPEKIVGHLRVGNQRDIFYRVKWRNMEEAKLIESSVMNAHRSDLIVDYYETKVKEDL